MGLPVEESDEYDTLAGWMLSELGHIPSLGENFEVEGVRFRVQAMRRRRIARVRAKRLSSEAVRECEGSTMERKLYRSRSDRMISGVCGGIADYFEIDPDAGRLIAVVLTIVSFGTALVVYVVMAIVVPEEPEAGVEGSGFAMADAPGQAAPPTPTPPGAMLPPEAPPVPPPPVPPPSYSPAPPPHRRPGRGGVVLRRDARAARTRPAAQPVRTWPRSVAAVAADHRGDRRARDAARRG